MIPYILSLLFLSLASICNSIMDKTTHHFHQSIFNDNTKQNKWKIWWNPGQSWKLKYVDGVVENGTVKWNILGFKFDKPVQISDGWHLMKTLMIIFLCTSITLMTLSPVLELGLPSKTFWGYLYNFTTHLIIMGFVWNKTFSLFYDKILVKK